MDNARRLEPSHGMVFESTKTYTHESGLSCAFRQWRAQGHSHCSFLHGYAIAVTITFGSHRLDERNWVQDFGGLKDLKEYLTNTFDHKTLVAQDDPQLEVFQQLSMTDTSHGGFRMMDIVVVDHVGCEAFAKMIFDFTQQKILGGDKYASKVWVQKVEVSEHGGNSAIYRRQHG